MPRVRLILILLAATACVDPVAPPLIGDGSSAYEGDQPGDCTNGADDDRDGLFDCADEGCAGARVCAAPLDASAPDTGGADASPDDAGDPPDDAGASPDAAAASPDDAEVLPIDENTPSPLDCLAGECGARGAWGTPLYAHRGVCAYSNGGSTGFAGCPQPRWSLDERFPVGCSGGSATSVVGPARSQIGYAFQCVDYARRATMARVPTWATLVGNACAWWHNAPAAMKHANGGPSAPQPDDLIVFDPNDGPCACPSQNDCRAGHIGVISEVDAIAGRIVVLDQNYQDTPVVLPYAAGTTHRVGDLPARSGNFPTLGWLRVSPSPDTTCGVRRFVRDPGQPNAAPSAAFEQLVTCPPGGVCDVDSGRCSALGCRRDVPQTATDLIFDGTTHCFTAGPYQANAEGCSAVVGLARSPGGERALLMRDLHPEDPMLVSPRLDWSITSDHLVQVEVACSGIQPPRAEARLFVAGNTPAPAFDLLPSVGPVAIDCDGASHTYEFPLATVATRTNRLGWLRLDPLDREHRFADGQVWIRSIRLLRGAPTCGNGRLDPGETCDGADLAGASCGGLGFAAGSLACSGACTLSSSGCCNHDCAVAGATACASPQAEAVCGSGFDPDACLELGGGRSCVNGCSNDRCRPSVRIDNPVSAATYSTAGSSVDVAGTFVDASTVRWTIAGSGTGSCTLSGGRFQCSGISLSQGSQDVVVTAGNGADSATATIRITRVSPTLAIAPSTGTQGTSFTSTARQCTPNGTVVLRATGPGGAMRSFSGNADGSGQSVVAMVTDATFALGRWSVVAEDVGSGAVSAPATFDLASLPCGGPSTQACGSCGTQARTCTNGSWSAWGSCTNQGACAPGSTQACGGGGTQSCDAQCSWGSCTGQPCTGPSTQACGSCGTQARTCTNGSWSAWGSCTNQGACSAGSTRTCGGTGTESCSSSCQWSGVCMGACASPCTAGAMRCSASGFVETCNPNGCGWSVSDNCSGFSVPARCCDDVRTRPQPQCVPTTVASSTLLLDPVNNATVRPGTVNLFWSPLVYSDRYRILVCTNAALNMGCLYNHFETPFGQNQYNVTLPAGTWYWSVAAIRACDYGGWGPFAPASRINVR